MTLTSQPEWADKQWDVETQEWHCSSCSEDKPLRQLGWCHSPKMSRRVLGRGLWKPSRSGCLSWTRTSTVAFSFPWSGTQSWTHLTHIPFSTSPSFTLFLFFIMFSKQYVYYKDDYLYVLLLIMHAYLWTEQKRFWAIHATYGSRGNYVSMWSSYFANFERNWLEVRTKLARSSFEVGP